MAKRQSKKLRTCPLCKGPKLLSKFHRNRSRSTGVESWCKVCKNRHSREYYIKIRRETIQAYGGKCVNCGKDFFEVLTIDHINNDGRAERQKISAGWAMCRSLRQRDFPPGYQVLCYDCNNLKENHPELLKEYSKYINR